MDYVIYIRESGVTYVEVTNNISGQGLHIWSPSLFRLYPQGINGIKRKLDFISLWLLYYLLGPPIKKKVFTFLLFDKEKVVHHSVVTTKSFKYPFMGENDLQIGMIFTEDEFRRRGLAAYKINEILRRYEKPGRKIWYITQEDNLASRRLAEKLGFSEYSKAIRKNVFLFGKYEMAAQHREISLKPGKVSDYSTITESPGLKATQEQVARIYQRYHFVRDLAEGKDVLEIGCGAGLGLGYLARYTKKVVGGDIEAKNISLAKQYYNGRPNITIDLMDAHNLPLPDGGFDLVLLFETIYYLNNPAKCISEGFRVLKEGGVFVVCTVNKDWEDFHPSPYTYKYFSVPELYELMKKNFQEVKLYGGFPTNTGGTKSEIASLIKRLAVKLHIIPRSLKGRAYLKRIFMGKLIPLPPEITEGMTYYEPPVPIPAERPNRNYKIIYAVAQKVEN